MSNGKTIAFFPEGAYGPALNSVGIAQACKALGHRPVFIGDPGFRGVFAEYGFEEYELSLSEPMPPEEAARYWSDFVDKHIPSFRKTPLEQLDNYVRECWEAIVDTARWAQQGLPAVLAEIKPDLICVDNVILFPAIKQCGVPWVRIVSCSENEIPDPDIAPYLSGCAAGDSEGFEKFRRRYREVLEPVHRDFNQFLHECGEAPYPPGVFVEESPWMNLLLYPKAARFERGNPLDPERFQYLEGCVRKEAPYQIPEFSVSQAWPLLYVSFGTLGAGDIGLMKRLISTLGRLPYRVLLNVGDYLAEYTEVPANIHLSPWFPQPSVIPQVDVVIHHGGNNSFTECLYFGKPALIMPYVWDGHDNATRVQETGHGLKLSRYDWTDAELATALDILLRDEAVQRRLRDTSTQMQARSGARKAAEILNDLLRAQVEAKSHAC
jgi:MGT family glycosyltransferase